jgi:lysine-specific demethylase 8
MESSRWVPAMQESIERTRGPKRTQIPRVRGVDIAAALADHRKAQRPLILERAGADWPAVKRWSPAYLAEVVGDIQVTPSVGLPDTEVPYNHRDRDFRRPMKVREFVELMRTGDRCYVDQVSVRNLPGLEHDFDFESLSPPDVKDVIIWMGASTRSGMHFDYVDNLYAQVHGTKLVILAAPEEARHLHPFPDSHSKSQVAPEHPDLDAHPRFSRATLEQSILEPGDVLFLPRAWWHYFASSESSISIACWHGDPLGPRHDLDVMLRMRSPKAWGLLVRDFVWHGVLGHARPRRLFSPPSTGEMLYHLTSSAWSRRKEH